MLTLLLINTFPDPIPNDFLKDKKYTDAKLIVTEINIFQIIHTELMWFINLIDIICTGVTHAGS